MTSTTPPPYSLPPPAPTPALGASLTMAEAEARNWGMAAHLSGLVGLLGFIPGFVGPLVVWLMKRQEHPFIDANGKEALNFQLSMLLYFVVSIVLLLLLVGVVLLIALGIAALVLPILGGIKAANGETWRYPLTIRFIK